MSYQSERLFELMDEYNKANPDTIKGIIAKVQSVFHFEVSLKKGGDTKVFTVDLKNGNGKDFFKNLVNFKYKLRKNLERKRRYSRCNFRNVR